MATAVVKENSAIDFDVVFIGSGPGGYTGAIRAAQLGLRTAVVEKEKTLGGTCLNVGCIPSKALLDSSEAFHDAKHKFADHGILAQVELDLARMMKRKDKIVGELTRGIAFLFKKNKIQGFTGTGRIAKPGVVEVIGAGGKTEAITTKAIVLASGSVPANPPGIEFDGKYIVSSTEALAFEEVPKHMVVVGGGVIGLELGSVWARLGAKVTVVEFTKKLCGAMDAQMTKELEKVLTKQGLSFLLGCSVTSASENGGTVDVKVKNNVTGEEFSLIADRVLVAVGRKAYSEGLGLAEAGVKRDKRGVVEVNENFETSVPGIYAIGDLIRGPMLAHKAEEEGVAVAEILATGHGHVNYDTVPGIVYTWPELASVGKTEEEVNASGTEYAVGTFPFMANGRAKALGTTEGLVKIIADKKTDRILGVHVLGPRASDVIAEGVMAMEFGASSEDMARAFHGHPTLSEVMREAALAVAKRARQA